MASTEPFIRPYRSSDFDSMSHICRSTLPPSLQGSEPAHRLAPYLWTHQYTLLSPKTCFVLDDGTPEGNAVGYCIGCPSIAAFIASYPLYITSILDPSPEVGRGGSGRPKDLTKTREPWNIPAGEGKEGTVVNETCLLQTAYNTDWLLKEGNEDVLEAGYKGTMHIDLLDEWQGKGWGRKLIESFVQSLKDGHGDQEASKGVWIGIAGDNGKVIPFYEKLGFRVWQREGAPKGGSICMVKDI